MTVVILSQTRTAPTTARNQSGANPAQIATAKLVADSNQHAASEQEKLLDWNNTYEYPRK